MSVTEIPVPAETNTYSPDPDVWHPVALLRRMFSESWQFRELVRRVIVRDLRAQYRQSLLGYLWAFIPAIATAVGFSLAKDAQVLRIADTTVPYFVFVMAGTVLWQTFIEALNGPIDAFNNFRSVLNRIYVPPEIIILAKMGEVFVNLSIKMILLALVLVIYRIPIGPMVALVPFLLFLLVLEGTAMGLILSPLSALYHDVQKAIPVVTGFWFLITPIAYPTPQRGVFAMIVKTNPATPILAATRDALTGGTITGVQSILLAGTLSLVGFFVALIAFRVAVPFVIERASE